MYKIMITGAGKIGSLIACLLADTGDYNVHLADIAFSGSDVTRLLERTSKIKTIALDVNNEEMLKDYLIKNEIIAIVSSLPFFLNATIARAAKAASTHYFDLTEDITVTTIVKAIAEDATTAFIPQCGLAPGYIGIVANSLIQEFDECHSAKLRVGALPQRVNNALHYSLTWSTDGVINEYGNPCNGIEKGKNILLKALEGLESIQIDGCEYEAFNTSGGLGSLADIYQGKISALNYKSIRYPGHCEKIRLLMNDLKLNDDRVTLKRILENALPKTYQDIVIIYVTVEGLKNGVFSEKSYFKKIYPVIIQDIEWSAIQISTAAGVCAVVDLVLADKEGYKGLILQETFSLETLLNNRFGHYFS